MKSEIPTGYRAVELFAGAGGMALGFENAGIHHIYLNEVDKSAVDTLRANRPGWHIEQRDVRQVDFRFLRRKAEVVVGGFPCQSFSTAGKRHGLDDERGLLFYELARAVSEIQPLVVVAENVKGLQSHDGGNTLRTMVAVLQRMGYRVAYRVVRAQYFDVPQRRERLIILAAHRSLQTPLLFPKPAVRAISLREALRDVPDSPHLPYSARKQRVLAAVPPGGCWRDLPDDLRREYVGDKFNSSMTGMARRLAWGEPSPTLLTTPQGRLTERCHPEETRPLTVREYARIQTFPDEWQFRGSTTSQYRQIGNAVPVNLAYHLGGAVAAMLDGQAHDGLEVAKHLKRM